MAERSLHLVRVPLRADRLATLARRRRISQRDLDEGYLTHCLLRELWQDQAPYPFVLRGNGRVLDAWGYSPADAGQLRQHAAEFADPGVLTCIDELDAIASREMPRFAPGRLVGFRARVCPVVRLARPVAGHRAGAEIDAFLARSFAAAGPEVPGREAVYVDWFRARLSDPTAIGAQVREVRVAGYSRSCLVRRTQGSDRIAQRVERPDVHLEGELVVEEGDAFLRFLAHGVGRHRAFGFGAMLIVPPGAAQG